MAKRKRGRPRQPETVTFPLRMRVALRQDVETAAELVGQSATQWIIATIKKAARREIRKAGKSPAESDR